MIGCPQADRKQPSRTWAGLGLVALVFTLTTVLTWRRWPDVLVDFGFQLYLPWQISSGKVLDRDLMYLPGGPFSIYYHAFLFKCFGTSYFTIIISNLAITAGTVVLICRKFLAATDRLTATIIGLAVVLVFTTGHYSETGNYNYLSPYAHEVVHGLALAIACVALLDSWLTKVKIRFAAMAGLAFGLVFLTKPEVFAALVVCVIAAFILCGLTQKIPAFLAKSAASFLGAAILPVLTFSLFTRAGLHAVLFPWQAILGKSIEKNPLYQWCLGLDAPAYNIQTMLLHFGGLALIVVILAWAFRRKFESSIQRIGVIALIATLFALASGFNWVECGRSLPLVVLTLCFFLGRQYKTVAAFPLLWSVFSLALLAKLGLYPRIWQYGFALGMPAFISAIYLLLWVLPQWLERFHVRSQFFRATIALLLLAGFIRLVILSHIVYRDKAIHVGSGPDTIMAYKPERSPVGPAINQALDWLQKNTSPTATLAVLPEGTIVNFLSRRVNPTSYPAWHPPELEAFGQRNMITDFQAHPADYVMLIHRDSAEYGRKYFGQEERFGKELMEWIGKNYQPVYLIGEEPLINDRFGIKILKRLPEKKKLRSGISL